MGCGCGKKKGTFDRPLTAGKINGATPVEAELKVSYGGMSAGQKAWITGDGVENWIDKGYIQLVPVNA